jgi:hypothetical protein
MFNDNLLDNGYTVLKLLEIVYKLANWEYKYTVKQISTSTYQILLHNSDIEMLRNLTAMNLRICKLRNHRYLNSFKISAQLELNSFSLTHYIYFDKKRLTPEKSYRTIQKRKNTYIGTVVKLYGRGR